MTIRRASQLSRSQWKYRKRLDERRRREQGRRLQLESLEGRQLLAAGPRLAGIQVDDGSLLKEGQVRTAAPHELTFHFNDGADLDASTVAQGIRITRAGDDGVFDRAIGTTDFNTNGQVAMDFRAVSSGESGNGISLRFIKNDLGVGVGPRISVQADAISIELNTRTGSRTTAAQLRDAINQHPQASQLVTASLRSSSMGTVDIATPAITYSPVLTGGANAASAVTNMNVGNNFQVKITAVTPGPSGNGIQVVINRVDFGGVRPPAVSVSGRTITVNVNSNSASPTTGREFVDAINAHPAASALVRAAVVLGQPDTVIGNRVNSGTQLRLAGSKDIPIEPGFIGLGASTREVVLRFKDPLPDDLYHVEILGTGTSAVRNVNGGAFGDATDDGVDNGVDFGLSFELNLGAQILAVVPQPVTRNATTNALQQTRNEIWVYFNNDDLSPTAIGTSGGTNPSVVDPAFYQLIFTNDTVHNQDDVVYRPTSIQYDPTTDRAVLRFDGDLDQLGSGPGTFRLRIGTDESIPVAPVRTTLTNFGQASTDFGTGGAAAILFQQVTATNSTVTVQFTKSDRGGGAAPGVTVQGQAVTIDLNTRAGSETTAAQVVSAVNNSAAARALISAALLNTPAPGNINVATSAPTPFTLTMREVGSSFDTALNLAVLGEQSQVLASTITAHPYDLPFPGAINEPGHRDLPVEVQQHYLPGFAADTTAGIPTVFYNFQDDYGFDPQGVPLKNAITEAQKQRAREVFSMYSRYLGVQFIETDNLGMTIVTGDLRAIDPTVTTGPGGTLGIAAGGLNGRAIMDAQDFSGIGADVYGGAWFHTAMHEIGHLLGLGHTDELPEETILDDEPQLTFPENTVEPVFPGDNDILHGQYLYRPDSNDIDLYRFEVRDSGKLTAETFAERLSQTSLLDTVVSVYRQERDGSRTLIARNDDYFSNDSLVDLDVAPGVYWIGVSASGNDRYDPIISDTGLGGRSEGNYELRLDFRPNADRSIVDSTGIELDGDGDGVPGGVFDFWFRAQDVNHTILVDKAAATDGVGTLASPFQLISTALAAAQPGDLVRIVGNGGADNKLETLADNLAYEIGFNQLGTVLADGATMDIPQGVTVMVDAGAVMKLRRARIGVGSSSPVIDQSGAALQVLGTPILLNSLGQVVRDADGNALPGSVYFTSVHDPAIGTGTNPDSQPPAPQPGDWGGIDMRRDIDARDANRLDYERAGIFLNYVAQADFRYGGGSVLVDGVSAVISPINMVDSRPTVIFNRITRSADAAMSASPNSFEESNFHSPPFQLTPFTADYRRVGPEIHGNTETGNSINGLFVRVLTPAGNVLQPMTVSGRWDDADITHFLADRLVVQGTPGGPILDTTTPSVQLVTTTAVNGGQLETGDYHYRVVFVDASGNETAPSNPTSSVGIDDTTPVRSIRLDTLPQVPQPYVAKRVYRSSKSGDVTQPYLLIAELNATSSTFVDTGANLSAQPRTLAVSTAGLRSRLDARLSIDPGVVVKLNQGAIETTFGADFYAEGSAGRSIVFTSSNDDRFGSGGTFDTTDNASRELAAPGDWGGILLGPATRGSFDHAFIGYGGGTVTLEGGFGALNAVAIHQADARIAHSRLENNAPGDDSSDRVGRGFNRPSTVFVRGAQPVIVDNVFDSNEGAAISINASALKATSLQDFGRSTYIGLADRSPIGVVDVARGNKGPLIRLNRLAMNDVNGLQVRGATLTTSGVWDDVDIVHVLRNESVVVPDFHTVGGLRLESSPTESLVIKLEGPNAGVTTTGRPLDIDDRIGGSLHVVGQPGKPVVMTSLDDCSVGAGFTPAGEPQNDTINSFACRPEVVRPDYADVIVVMDESASMFFAQSFSVQMIQDLENSLVSAGVGAGASGGNRYGLVGFGGAANELPGHAHPVGPSGALFGTATEYAVAATTLTDLGGFEDGYDAIHYAIQNYPVRAAAAKFIILVSNEDRDILSPQYTFANTLSAMNTAGFKMEAIITADIRDASNAQALALDGSNNAFSADGSGGFTVSPNGRIVPFVFDTSVQDYANMAFATGGVTGDISQIQAGGATATSFSNVIASQILVQAGGGNPARPGDWRSVRLDKYTNDRNVSPVVESESSGATAGVGNGTPALAQFMGALAPNEKSGDENLRLGFAVEGTLADRGDVDVYSFQGTAGTEVWLDLDGTANSLDTVVELVDGNGNVLARSNDSGAEAANPSLLFRSSAMPAGTVNPLRKAGYDPLFPTRESPYAINDMYTTNPRDAGMRVVLPGTPGATATYHVRVRSNGPNLSNLNGGLTLGTYQLQVRLRELNEVPGATVRYADVRYASTGIEILGQPIHSPLLGEAAEIEGSPGASSNDTQANAQVLGNLLQTDRAALSLSGNIALPTDVDFYQVTVEYDSIQGAGPSPHASTIFDIDYTDGLARPNTTLWVFDSQGRLILRGTGSNVADDRPSALSGSGTSDLSRGSTGAADPYIGPVALPAGPDRLDPNSAPPEREIYYVAVTSNGMSSDVLRQFLDANVPADIASVRLEPINSLQRIAEDRIGFSGGSNIAQPPKVPLLVDPTQSFVPFHLGDVTLFVSQGTGLAPSTVSTLRTVDAFTGTPETVAGSFAQPISDIAMRGDGNVFAYSIGPNNFQGAINSASTGLYVQIDTGTGATTTFNDDGVEEYVNDPANPGTPIRPGANNAGVGITYSALTYLTTSNTQLGGYVVGSRNDSSDNDPDIDAFRGVGYLENILYNFDINTGAVVNRPSGAADKTGAALLTGAGTQRIEVGEILTYTRITPQAPEVGDQFVITINGKSIRYTATGFGGAATVQEVVAGLATAWRAAALTTPEFAAFEVLNDSTGPRELRVRLTDPSAANYDIVTSTVNGGFANESLNSVGFGPGGTVTGLASVNGQLYAVSDRGGLYQVSQFGGFGGGGLATYVRNSAIDLMTAANGQSIQFSGLTRGPVTAEGGKYASMLFGISTNGQLYAFDLQGNLQPVFVNNQTSVSTGLSNISGLAFSTLDRNLWTVTSNRGSDIGHGLDLTATGDSSPFDSSRVDAQQGGSSIFFGNDQGTNRGGNQSFSNTGFVRDYNFPGGAYGSVVTNPFSLEGYAADDLPVMYFNYYLETENTDYNPVASPIVPTRDTLRVYVSGDDGNWNLLATNDLYQDAVFSDEFESGPNDSVCLHPAFATEPCVQRLFDNTGAWRQARIPLGRFAGQDNLRVRFDFSTAGSMNVGDTFTVGSEIRAVAGNELRDGQTLTLDGSRTFEVDAGYTIVAPNGAGLQDGNSFTVTDSQGQSQVFEFDSDGFFSRSIVAANGGRLLDGDSFRVRAGNTTKSFEFDSGISLHVPATGGNVGGLRDADRFTIDGVTFEFDKNGTATATNVINLIVDSGIQIPASVGGAAGLNDGDQLVINDGVGGADVVFEFDQHRPSQVTPGAVAVDITNLQLQVPVAGGGFGGIQDGDFFTVNDGVGGLDVVFEFDKNNIFTAGNRPIAISDQFTQAQIADLIVTNLQLANLGLKPVNLGGGVVRLGVFRHDVSTAGAATLQRIVVDANQDEIAERLTDSILNSPLGLVPVYAGNGQVRLGSTTVQVSTAAAPSVQSVSIAASQSQATGLIVNAILNSSLSITPVDLGNGEIYLGRQVTSVNTSQTPSLRQTGATGLANPAAVAVVVSRADSANTVASAIAAAINGSGLGITTVAAAGVVQLPANAAFSPDLTPLAPLGIQPVTFSAQDEPAKVATSIQTAMQAAFSTRQITANLTPESNDTLATAQNANLPGGAVRYQATGTIGDNIGLRLRGTDVDVVRLDLQAGENVQITVAGSAALRPTLRLFRPSGEEITTVQRVSTTTQTQLIFQAVSTGTYYVGVSGSSNLAYDPLYEGSADITLRVPAQGGAVGGLTDGESFTITDGGSTVLFEFDVNGQVTPNAVPILLANPSPLSQSQVATLIRDAIRNNTTGLQVSLGGNGAVILDGQNHRVDATLAPHLTFVAPSSTGAYTLSVEIQSSFQSYLDGNRLNLGGVSNVSTSGLPAGFLDGTPGISSPSRTPVRINSSMTRAEVAQAIAEGIGRSTAGYVQQIVAPSGAAIRDGEIFSIGDGQRTANFEFDTGFSLQLPNPAADPGAYLDGESFSIESNGNVTTFEFDDDGMLSAGNIGVRINDTVLTVPFFGFAPGGITEGNTIQVTSAGGTTTTFEFDSDGTRVAGNLPITVTAGASRSAVADAIVLALTRANIGLTPVNLGQGQVQLAVTTQTVSASGTPAMAQTVITLSQNQVADRVAAAIRGAGLGLTPTNLGAGFVHIGGNSSQIISVANALNVQVVGAPGTQDSTAIAIPIVPAVSTSPSEVAQLMLSSINTAITTRGLAVTAVASGARRINLSSNELTTEFSKAPSLTVNSGDDSIKVYDNIVKVIGHTVTNRGPFGLENSLAGDSFGAFTTSGPPNVTRYPGALRGMDNAREGAYIDDIVIGFAERGEMITGAAPNANFITNNDLFNPSLPVGLVPHNEILVGPYQLEVRRAEIFGQTIQDPAPELALIRAFDTNDRLTQQTSLTASAGWSIRDGQTLVVSDGYRSVVYEFNDLDLNNGVTAGRVAIGYRISDSDVVMARRIRDVINSPQSQSLLKVSATLSDGTATGTASTSNTINFSGNAVVTVEDASVTSSATVAEPNDRLITATSTGIGTGNVTRFIGTGAIGDNTALTNVTADVDLFSVQLKSGETLSIDVTATQQQGFLDGVLRVFNSSGTQLAVNDDTIGVDPHIDFTAAAAGIYYIGVSGFSNFFYNPQLGTGASATTQYSNGSYEITIEKTTSGFGLQEYDDFGDSNVTRDQGQILIESSRITRSAGFGIVADAGARDGAGNLPHAGVARLTRELNAANLVPGVTIANNLITRNNGGGIRFSGEGNNAQLPLAAIPFGRIYNNTIVGTGGSTVGIAVEQNSSPTLLNNIVSNLGTGISVDATSATTVIGGTVYHRVATRTTGTGAGSFPIDVPDAGPLFVDQQLDNFYLASGSLAIDSSINSVPDRPEMLAVKSPLGYAPSPILAPDRDALGQTRVDDPSVNTPPGQGGSVFKDRGALDRADFTGPSAVMLVPGDNDQQGNDTDSRPTYIGLTNIVLDNFSIQLLDGIAPTDPREGTGADDTTVQPDRVTVLRDGEKLIAGLDYTFHYDATNNIIRLTPLAGIWESDRVYEIVLSNSEGSAIASPNGAQVQDGNSFRITDVSGNQVDFEYDSGYVLRVPQTLALQIPEAGGAAIADGEKFSITDGTTTEVFEFDNNGVTSNSASPRPTPPYVIVRFTTGDSANDLANKIIAAIKTTSLSLAPVNIVNSIGRAVHLGSTSSTQLDTTNTTLQQTGQAGGIEAGQSFTIDDGTKVVTFTFAEGSGGSNTATNRFVSFSRGQTNEQIADGIVAAIRAAAVNLTPTHAANSDGLIHVGGTTRHVVNAAASQLALSGLPGVRPAWSLKLPTVAGQADYSRIVDGQTFSVTNGITTAVFEFDSDGRSASGNRAISFNSRTTTDQLANAMAIAIRNAGLGLSPTNAGGGMVTLGGTLTHLADLSGSMLTQSGSPGIPAAQPVTFIPGDVYTPGIPIRTPIFSESQMAQAIAAAIQSAKAQNLLGPAVQAVVRDNEVLVDGVADITGVTNVFRSNVRDVAGNSLKPNRSDGTTAFTIFIGSGLDYGDAPAPYPTLEADNGARHEIVGDLFLGAGVDIDFDGQPSADALGDDTNGLDDEDGVVVSQALTGSYGGAVSVTASSAGYLDAWIDFNQDGDWNDAGEQIFASRPLQAGLNADLPVNVPGSAIPGSTYARFRFSSKGGLAPVGPATDGEVEDYRVQVQGNPWRNPILGPDVDRSGFVVPMDVLILLNDLNRNGIRELPNPPPAPVVYYLDVNGDRFASQQDVLAVLNYLINRPQNGEGEGGEVDATGQTIDTSSLDANAGGATLASLPLAPNLGADVAYVDHRLNLADSEDSEEPFADFNAFGEASELVAAAVASDPRVVAQTSLDELLASNVDQLFDGILDELTG